MVRNYYVRRDVDRVIESLTNKLPGAGLQTSYVHSSKRCQYNRAHCVLYKLALGEKLNQFDMIMDHWQVVFEYPPRELLYNCHAIDITVTLPILCRIINCVTII